MFCQDYECNYAGPHKYENGNLVCGKCEREFRLTQEQNNRLWAGAMGRRDGADDVLVDEHGIRHPTERQKSEIRQHLRKAFEDLKENPNKLELDPDNRDDYDTESRERTLFWYNKMIEGVFFNERDKLDKIVNEAVTDDFKIPLYMLLGKHRELIAEREERLRKDPNFFPEKPKKYEHLDYSELIRCGECSLVMSLDEFKSLQVKKCSNCDNALEVRIWSPRRDDIEISICFDCGHMVEGWLPEQRCTECGGPMG